MISRSLLQNHSNYLMGRTQTRAFRGHKYLPRSWDTVEKSERNTSAALNHFDSLYSRVYGRAWPSMRLGLLSPRKSCALLNSFVDDIDKWHKLMVEELGAIDLQRYYKKHLHSYTRWQLRQKILENKKARKRELMAKNHDVDPQSIDLDSIEVSDVSDSELRGACTTDSGGGFSTAEDLQAMFSDRRMDDDERYFINQASTKLSLNDYVPATELIYHEDVSDELSYYNDFGQDVELPVEYRMEPTFETDTQLNIYTFPRTSWSPFPQPTKTSKARLEFLPYYLLDGASMLAVLALDLRIDDVCADFCAAPGGKSLAMLMSLKPKYLLCNDSSASRMERLSRVMKQYVPNIQYFRSTLETTRHDARKLMHPETFDKILVDVPCSNDRNSVEKLDNNIFSHARTEERLSLPKTQCDILKTALKSLKPKGSVVYSTCTMSPVENDGVIQRALLQLHQEDPIPKFAIMNLKEAFRPFRGLFTFDTRFKYGQQIVPNVCSNFGPMYISKIKRLS